MKNKIMQGKTYLGIELGSTRIKAALIDDHGTLIAAGSFSWENRMENGYWTYSLDEVHTGVRACFADLSQNVSERYGVSLSTVGAIGISAMMHGYLAFDRDGQLLAPFRTWRNTTTAQAADELTRLFDFNIPQRWSIAHLYQAILDGEDHVGRIAHITTLSGYVHYLLSGRWELGIGDASGVFPVSGTDYDADMLTRFDRLVAPRGYDWKIAEILPGVALAGAQGAMLTAQGAVFLDPTGTLAAGIPLCPPEGDAGTGMVATNAIRPKTGNVSAGTSVFAMLVLERPLCQLHREVDVVTTPEGSPVAMVHCNNCSAELDAWVNVFGETLALFGHPTDRSTVYEALYRHAMTGAPDGGSTVACNYLSGEHITGIGNGHPMYLRQPTGKLTLADLMRAELYASVATLKLGMDILQQTEGVRADLILAHGGLFKVKGVMQQVLADALDTPVSVMETASEGGAWGMALLAAYMMCAQDASLCDWLDVQVFGQVKTETLTPNKAGVRGFAAYMERYREVLTAQRTLDRS